jgi:hypothetical protein
MPNIGFDEAEAMDFYGDESAEDYFEGDDEDFASDAEDFEDYDDSEASVRDHRRAEARRRARRRDLARRRALVARRRAALARARRPVARARRPSPATAKAEVRETKAAVQELSVETEMQAETAARGLARQRKSIAGSEAAVAANTVATTVANQLQATFPRVASNPFVRAGLPLTALAFLRPAKRASGFQGLVTDPRVWGSALVGGVAIAGEITNRVRKVDEVRITRFATHLPPGATFQFVAEALDSSGAVLSNKKITWGFASPTTAATVDPNTGLVTAGSPASGTTLRADIVAEVDVAPAGTKLSSQSVPVTVAG